LALLRPTSGDAEFFLGSLLDEASERVIFAAPLFSNLVEVAAARDRRWHQVLDRIEIVVVI